MTEVFLGGNLILVLVFFWKMCNLKCDCNEANVNMRLPNSSCLLYCTLLQWDGLYGHELKYLEYVCDFKAWQFYYIGFTAVISM